MKQPKRYLVTSALPYANGPLHIGHLAGAYLPADIYVRWLRGMGEDVLHVCGSDEHGAAITIKARQQGVTPREIVDKYHQLFQETFRRIGVDFDVYHRTSSPLHHETSQDFFRQLYQQGAFVEQESEQYYDEEAQAFLADRYITGTCPRCQHPNAYGDQCENCGSSLSPTELIEPRSTLTGNAPVLRSTRHWYLPLDQHEEWLRPWITEGTLDGNVQHDPSSWKNHVLGQCRSWLDAGLQPRAMTRDLDWGVDVPEEIPGAEGKKLYVWLDAPIGYISATKAWAEETGGDWKAWWQDADTALIHFIGKDNIVFHCLIFPVILRTAGMYNLPVNVPANQFMNLEGDKISTSRNWAVWVHEYVDEFPGQEDSLRYNLIRNMPEQRDAEFTWKQFQEMHNSELVNNLANFVNRVVVLLHKYYDGVVPDVNGEAQLLTGQEEERTITVREEIQHWQGRIAAIDAAIRKQTFRDAMQLVMDFSACGNLLLQRNEPWKKIKQEPDVVPPILYVAVQLAAALARVMRPFLPFGAERLATMLGMPSQPIRGELAMVQELVAAGEPILPSGHHVGPASHLYSRIPDEVIEAQVAKLQPPEEKPAQSKVPPAKEEITFDQFAGMDIRTGTIVEAKKVPKADRLLELKVDVGFETRTVVSGIAEHFTTDEVVGKQVLVLVNLAPRKLRGILSQGMILMAEDGEGQLHFVAPMHPIENGHSIS